MIGQECVDEVAFALEGGQFAHSAQMRGALDVEVALSGTAQHESKDHFDEQIRLKVWRGFDGLAQPGLEFVLPALSNGIELSIRPPSLLDLPRSDFPITGQSGQGGVDLAELEWLASAEVGVVVAFEVVAITRFMLEETEEGKEERSYRNNRLSL